MKYSKIFMVFLFVFFLAFAPDRGFETVNSLGQDPGAGVKTAVGETKDHLLKGRILDGLGRPVADVRVEILVEKPGREDPLEVAKTDETGRFMRWIAGGIEHVRLVMTKEDYIDESATLRVADVKDFTLRHKIDWQKASDIPYLDADKVDDEVRELLASEEDDPSERELLGFIFKNQASLRPVLRRLIKDPHVGDGARTWLDKLGDPADRGLFPQGRKYAPKHEIAEEDLVEAIKAISGHLNFFSSAPEPRINIESITFTPKLDRALIKCGINLAPMTGVFWEFIFQKEGKRWVLRSMEEAGRG